MYLVVLRTMQALISVSESSYLIVISRSVSMYSSSVAVSMIVRASMYLSLASETNLLLAAVRCDRQMTLIYEHSSHQTFLYHTCRVVEESVAQLASADEDGLHQIIQVATPFDGVDASGFCVAQSLFYELSIQTTTIVIPRSLKQAGAVNSNDFLPPIGSTTASAELELLMIRSNASSCSIDSYATAVVSANPRAFQTAFSRSSIPILNLTDFDGLVGLDAIFGLDRTAAMSIFVTAMTA